MYNPEIRNEMEIFITLTKYNTSQRRKEGKPLFVVTTKSAYLVIDLAFLLRSSTKPYECNT